MTTPTFIEQCLGGSVSPDAIDDFVDAWHKGEGSGEELSRYLGFNSEYALWVARPEMLDAILEARRADRFAPRTR